MKNRRWKRLALLAVLLSMAFACFRALVWYQWLEHADPATGVALELGPASQVIKIGEAPSIRVALINRGENEVKLVEPGDGSECGWRTPLIDWSWDSWFSSPRCGNVNPLKANEVFILRPGESKQLRDWVEGPPFSHPGRYKVAVRYTNVPDHWCKALENQSVLEAVQSTAKVSTVSNSVEIVVEE